MFAYLTQGAGAVDPTRVKDLTTANSDILSLSWKEVITNNHYIRIIYSFYQFEL